MSPRWHCDFNMASITHILFRSICFSRLLMRIIILNDCRRQDPLLLVLRAQGFRHQGWANRIRAQNTLTGAPQEGNTYLLLIDTLWYHEESYLHFSVANKRVPLMKNNLIFYLITFWRMCLSSLKI